MGVGGEGKGAGAGAHLQILRFESFGQLQHNVGDFVCAYAECDAVGVLRAVVEPRPRPLHLKVVDQRPCYLHFRSSP